LPNGVAPLITPTPWDALKAFTDARIALGLPTLALHSQATQRAQYLQRPDLGRRLDAASLQTLASWQTTARTGSGVSHRAGDAGYDIALVVADGLSALAIHQNAILLVANLLQRLRNDPSQTWHVAPIVVVEQGRVAIGDEVGASLSARVVVVLIGERPGLGRAESMSAYMAYRPKPGDTDADRDVICNIFENGGANPLDAGANVLQLALKMRQYQASGVKLKLAMR